MTVKVGDRIMGEDGTYRKVLAIKGGMATVQVGLSPVEEKLDLSALGDWAAPSPPGKPQPSDYDDADPGITIRQLTDEEIDRAG